MSWSLFSAATDKSPSSEFRLWANSLSNISYIVQAASDDSSPPQLEVVQSSDSVKHKRLAQITVEAGCAKLEAVDETLSITFRRSGNETNVFKYELKPADRERTEVLLLRDGDEISSAHCASALTCKWSHSEVQVNSSANDAVIAESVANDHNETPEHGTENEDEDGDSGETPIAVLNTQSKSQQPRATPMPGLLHQRSIIVQETPTTARTHDVENLPAISANGVNSSIVTNLGLSLKKAGQKVVQGADLTPQTGTSQPQSLTNIKNPDFETSPVDSEMTDVFDAQVAASSIGATSKRFRSSPEVRPKPSRKRPSPAIEEHVSNSDMDRLPKRAKNEENSQNDAQDSRLSTIEVERFPNAAKKRKSLASAASGGLDDQTRTPSQRDSHRSKASQGNYEGPAPRVLLSNSSTITKSSQFAKWLKKQGGALVDSLTDGFDMLCLKDGELAKTPKLLAAIARGVPIVTDKWLIDSAKANQLLSTITYSPIAPKQEKEWGVRFVDIFGQPQTPFDGYTIHFTKSLKAAYAPFSDIEQVCKAAGATKVTSGRLDAQGDVIVLAKDENDGEIEKLAQDGVQCYSKDLITNSIFHGSLETKSSFRLLPKGGAESATTEAKKKKKGRRSK